MPELVQIQDDIIRRALNFFGLRGLSPHEYSNVITPVVLIGNLRQPVLWRTNQQAAAGASVLLHTVPQGESWNILEISGSIIQAGGATPARYGILIEAASGSNISLRVPFWPYANSAVKIMESTITLNSNQLFAAELNRPILVSSGSRFSLAILAGDGTLTQQLHLQYEVLGERLVENV